MAKLTMVFGVLIALVGVAGYMETHFWHAFIPVVLGFLLVLLGLIANTEDVKRRMVAMHIAVTLGLLGFLGTIPGLIAMFGFLTGTHQQKAEDNRDECVPETRLNVAGHTDQRDQDAEDHRELCHIDLQDR